MTGSTKHEKALGEASRAWTEALCAEDHALRKGYDGTLPRLRTKTEQAERKYRALREQS